VQKLLREYGHKVTPARLAVLNIFARSKSPLAAEDVQKKLQLDLVTVYRTLAVFEKSGILIRVNLGKDSAHYELARNHHHHIVCTNCDRVEDFRNEKVEKILASIVRRSSKFIKIREHSLELFGLCSNCV